jgi:hypothetical protein
MPGLASSGDAPWWMGDGRPVANARGSAAALIEADCRDPWQAIDSVLGSLAERSRRYSRTDEVEEVDEEVLLRERLEAVTRERDQLRVRLRAAQRQIRALRAGLEPQTPPMTSPQTATGSVSWLRWLLDWRPGAR